jgi:hypothetical protein
MATKRRCEMTGRELQEFVEKALDGEELEVPITVRRLRGVVTCVCKLLDDKQQQIDALNEKLDWIIDRQAEHELRHKRAGEIVGEG